MYFVSSYFDFMVLSLVYPAACPKSAVLQSQKELSKAKQSSVWRSCFVLLLITTKHSLQNMSYAKIRSFSMSCGGVGCFFFLS